MDLVSRALAPEEREAVRGDITESGATAGRALLDVLGMIVRRQAASWSRLGTWVILLCLVLPLSAILLSMVSRTATLTAVYSWLYVNNWTPGYLAAGFRQDLLHNLAFFAVSCFKLIFVAWSAGLALGFISRRSIGSNGLLFLLVLVAGLLLRPHSQDGGNGPVFLLSFYRRVLPIVMLAVLVVIPSIRGMHDGLRFSRRFTHEAN
ncbi:MAG TPA: hypothetical protein VGK64_01470 [Bryobacteraceae bacterium]